MGICTEKISIQCLRSFTVNGRVGFEELIVIFFRQGSIDAESFDYKRLKPVWYYEFACKY